MMIEIHISDKTNILIQKLCKIIQIEPLSNPLQKEIFIVNNEKIAQWIKIVVAKKLGIAANLKFYTPLHFCLKFLKKTLISFNYTWSYHDPDLFWKILCLQNNQKINIPFLKTKDSQIKKIKLVSYISKMFQNYLKYRPNWINYWNINVNIPNIRSCDQKWQKELWMLIKTHNLKLNLSKWNLVNLFNLLNKKTIRKKIKKKQLLTEYLFLEYINSILYIYLFFQK